MSKLKQSWQRVWRGVLGTVFLVFASVGVGSLQGCAGAMPMPVDDDVQDIDSGGCESPAEVDPDVEVVPAEQVPPEGELLGR